MEIRSKLLEPILSDLHLLSCYAHVVQLKGSLGCILFISVG